MTPSRSRRSFLRTAGLSALSAPWILHRVRAGAPLPSETLSMACIGVGGQGTWDTKAFLSDPRVRVTAVCDVDRNRLAAARGMVEDHYAELRKSGAYAGCLATGDYRELTARDDIDAVMIATPDHTHALITVDALRNGKDVYCEKPLAYTVAEGRAVADSVSRYGRVLQTGTQRRSNGVIRHACELVRNGYFGSLKHVRVGLPQGFAVQDAGVPNPRTPCPVPEHFDYDKWLGPAPLQPYAPGRCHFNFRWILDYGEGYISDWGAHYLDVAHWGMGKDETGPADIVAEAVFPKDGLYDAPTDFTIEYTYADGMTMTCSTREALGILFEGENGSVHIEKPGAPQILTDKPEVLKAELGPGEVRLRRSASQHADFIDCVLSRALPAAHAGIGHRSAAVCHVGMIAARLGRPLRWDPVAEVFPGDTEANRLLARPMRHPWVL